jgi:hypothetical protein
MKLSELISIYLKKSAPGVLEWEGKGSVDQYGCFSQYVSTRLTLDEAIEAGRNMKSPASFTLAPSQESGKWRIVYNVDKPKFIQEIADFLNQVYGTMTWGDGQVARWNKTSFDGNKGFPAYLAQTGNEISHRSLKLNEVQEMARHRDNQPLN